MNATSFWFFEWLDAYGVKSMRTATRTLASSSALEAIHDLAVKAQASTQAPLGSEFSLVAGRGLDLSGHLDCNASACRRRQVDKLFRQAWHYFDQIVVADGISHEVSKHWDAPRSDLRRWLLSHIEVLLYLRKLGAESLLVFREKPAPCEVHWDRHAANVGLQSIVAIKDAIAEELLSKARVITEDGTDGSIAFTFIHPDFEHYVWGSLPPSDIGNRSPAAVRHAAALVVVRRYLAHLTSDVAMSRRTTTPLGSTVWFHGELLKKAGRGRGAADVAFELELPILNAVPLDALVKLRTDEHDAFVRFRYALRRAIAERMKVTSPARSVAEEIRRDLIEPEIERIRQRLASAGRMLGKKAAVGVGLGSLVTVCGLLAGIDPAVATVAGIGSMTTVAGAAAAKHVEEQREAGLADMYFLWKALEHTKHEKA